MSEFEWSEYSGDSANPALSLLISERSQSLILSAMRALDLRSNWTNDIDTEDISDAEFDEIEKAVSEAYTEILEPMPVISPPLKVFSLLRNATSSAIGSNAWTAIPCVAGVNDGFATFTSSINIVFLEAVRMKASLILTAQNGGTGSLKLCRLRDTTANVTLAYGTSMAFSANQIIRSWQAINPQPFTPVIGNTVQLQIYSQSSTVTIFHDGLLGSDDMLNLNFLVEKME